MVFKSTLSPMAQEAESILEAEAMQKADTEGLVFMTEDQRLEFVDAFKDGKDLSQWVG